MNFRLYERVYLLFTYDFLHPIKKKIKSGKLNTITNNHFAKL